MLRRIALLAVILSAAACDQNPTTPTEAVAIRAPAGPGFLALPINDAVWSMAYGVSETGWLAGEVDVSDTEWHAARWRVRVRDGGVPEATLEDLGQVNGRATFAFGVNRNGDVVGGSVESSSGLGDGPDQAFVYHNGVMQVLPTLGGPNGFARRINSWGWIVGQSDTQDGQSHATLWRPRRHGGYDAIDLGTLGGTFSWCNTIDDLGRVVGLSETASGAVVAWRWDGFGPLRRLPSLTPGNDNYAVDFNLWGVIVGNGTTAEGDFHAARWFNGAVQDLHGRFPGYVNSLATGINLANDIIVSADDQDFAINGFLLKNNSTIRLGESAGTPESDVYGISDFGWMAGGAGEGGVFSAGVWLPKAWGQSIVAGVRASGSAGSGAASKLTQVHRKVLKQVRAR